MPASNSLDKVLERIRPGDTPEVDEDPLTPFLSVARWISHGVSPFADLDRIFEVPCNNVANPPTELERKQYAAVIGLHPDLKQLSELLAEDQKARDSFVSKMTKAMKARRSSDQNLLKPLILDLAKDASHPFSPVASKKDKTGHGWKSRLTSRALCPMLKLAEFDADPCKFMKHAEDGDIKLYAHDLPAFVYPWTDYDVLDPDYNLCRSDLIINVLRLIYTGPTSVDDGKRAAGRLSASEVFGIHRVTPEMVGNVIIHIYIALSSETQVTDQVGFCRLDHMFNHIVELLEPSDHSTRPQETLDFLMSKVPGLNRQRKSRKRVREVIPDEAPMDPTGILARRRRIAQEALEAREAAEALARNPPPSPARSHTEPPAEPENETEPHLPPPAGPVQQRSRARPAVIESEDDTPAPTKPPPARALRPRH